jgi:hypothetical protein
MVHVPSILVSTAVGVGALLLSVPGPLVALMTLGSGYVAGRVMIRRMERAE